MEYAKLANAGVLGQPVYEPGKPIELVARDYELKISDVAKLASNENPFGPSPLAIAAMQAKLGQLQLYPDGACVELRSAIANEYKIVPESIIVGNGSNELIELLGHVFLGPETEVVMSAQAFIVYKLVAKLFGARAVEVPMVNLTHDLQAMREAVTDKTRLIFVASPNNPTGTANSESDLLQLAQSLPKHVILCVDEAYAEYLERAPDLRPTIAAGHKVICLRTFSKIYGLGGLRIGYGYADPELIGLLQRVRQPFNVNSLAQVAASAAITDKDFINRCRRENELGRKRLCSGLSQLGIKTYGGHANFVLCEVTGGESFSKELLKRGIIIRPLNSYNMPNYIRISIGNPDENEKLLLAVEELLAEKIE
ncbi:MAG: histidinol-phosphate transaminase [Verrucomicrobiota bacterium]|nr:histidinol-phosphate transaminase [Verrucomicrobiota bacterium]